MAALFRDMISHYIDGGLNRKQQELIAGVLMDHSFVLNPKLFENPRDGIVAKVFGYGPGENLVDDKGLHKGLDVFLSAMLATRLLHFLSPRHTAQLTACLEATVPFRPSSALETLYNRLVECNTDYNLGMDESELVETVQQAVDLRNRSVGNMLADDLAEFLDHTWNLLPEQHAALRKSTLYTLTDYYLAIRSMLDWLGHLEPESVYGVFRGVPSASDALHFEEVLTRNLAVSHIYLQARMMAVAVVASLAVLTGGDAPKSFFFGDLPTLHQESEHIGEHVPLEEAATNGSYNKEVFELLLGERITESGFDIRNAYLAAYIYQQLGDERLSAFSSQYCVFPLDDTASWALLKALPKDLVTVVGRALNRIAVTRSCAIDKVIAALPE